MDAAHRALELVAERNAVGLGSGRAATAFIQALGKRVSEGLRVRGIATSETSARLAERLHIPFAPPEEVEAIDGADEVDPHGGLIKGYGGALIREKIVAASARRFGVLVGSHPRLPHDPDRGSTGPRFRDPRDPGGAGNEARPRHGRYDTGRGRRRRRSARDESAMMGAEAIAPPARWAGPVGARRE